jgi:ribosomal-protein-serine acetyltransferase
MNCPDIVIRPYQIEDAADVFHAVRESLAKLIPWMPWCHPNYSLQETQNWLELQILGFQKKENFEFAILSEDGRYLGGCGLNQIDKVNRNANLGYWVRSDVTRQGIATDAVRLLRDWGFENTDLIRFEIVISVGNHASHRVAEKSGAIREGIARSRLLVHESIRDATVFSFIRTDY